MWANLPLRIVECRLVDSVVRNWYEMQGRSGRNSLWEWLSALNPTERCPPFSQATRTKKCCCAISTSLDFIAGHKNTLALACAVLKSVLSYRRAIGSAMDTCCEPHATGRTYPLWWLLSSAHDLQHESYLVAATVSGGLQTALPSGLVELVGQLRELDPSGATSALWSTVKSSLSRYLVFRGCCQWRAQLSRHRRGPESQFG